MMKETAKLYTHPAAYAREHGELEEYRASFKANVACKEAIEAAIHAHYSDNRLNTDAVFKQGVDAFGADRVEYVLAATVREKNWDGRISRENKAWAQTVPVMQNPDAWGTDRNCYFVVDQAHTGLVDLLVTHVRKNPAKDISEPAKKASVLEKLQKPSEKMKPPANDKKVKGQEL
jgi:hypothetical protein